MINLAHHWLVTYRGGEKVLEQFRYLFPDAPLSTLVLVRGQVPEAIVGANVRCSFLQFLPTIMRRRYKAWMTLFPVAFRNLSVAPGTRLVLSSDAAMVKTLRVPPDVPHVCYCHSPPRYVWDMEDEYEKAVPEYARWVFRVSAKAARFADRAGADRVTFFIANSEFVRQRIRTFYNRDAAVIYPPVEVEAFSARLPRGDFYLIVSQLVPYKRVDLAVEACSRLGRNLVVIGEGSEAARLANLAGPSVSFLGRQPFDVVKSHMERCRAFIYPQVEDFGITAVEAQAAGAPVIAFKRGGALESVKDGVSGMFFTEQSATALSAAVLEFERREFSSRLCRHQAARFSATRFRKEIREFLEESVPSAVCDHNWPE